MDVCTLLCSVLIQLSLSEFTWNQADGSRKSKKAKDGNVNRFFLQRTLQPDRG